MGGGPAVRMDWGAGWPEGAKEQNARPCLLLSASQNEADQPTASNLAPPHPYHPPAHSPLAHTAQQPWRLEVRQEVRTAQASAKVRASLRPGVACGLPELLLVGGEDCAGE